jgi:IS5 family transposase
MDEQERAKNRTKSSVRSKVEHRFQVMKLKFGFVKVRYRGLKKNAHQLFVICGMGQSVSQPKEAALGDQRITGNVASGCPERRRRQET